MRELRNRWLDRIRRRLLAAERGWDRRSLERRRQGPREQIAAVCYRTWSSPGALRVHGRVLAGIGGTGRARLDDTPLQNARIALQALISHEVPDHRVEVGEQADLTTAVTDEEGYFRARVRVPEAAETGWREVVVQPDGGNKARAETLVVPFMPSLGVISDIDDTVMHSAVSNPLRAARLALFSNAVTRTPLDGAAALYRALHEGRHGTESNPVFYVSSGPWNLYRLVRDFLDHHEFPKGSIAMQDYGFDESRFGFGGHAHKLTSIEEILLATGETPFLLIGDSTQDDPVLYAEAAKRYPNRIAAILIRDMSPRERRRVQTIAEDVSRDGIDMLMIRTANEARAYCEGRGWIPSNDR